MGPVYVSFAYFDAAVFHVRTVVWSEGFGSAGRCNCDLRDVLAVFAATGVVVMVEELVI